MKTVGRFRYEKINYPLGWGIVYEATSLYNINCPLKKDCFKKKSSYEYEYMCKYLGDFDAAPTEDYATPLNYTAIECGCPNSVRFIQSIQ